MNRGQLIARLKAKGHDYLTDDEAAVLVDQAVEDTGNKRRWTYRMSLTAMDSSSIAENLVAGSIVGVSYDGSDLPEMGLADVVSRRRGQAAQSGTPLFWFRQDGSIWVEPQAAGAIIVHSRQNHWTTGGAVPADDLDTPSLDDDYHDIILLRARALALEETDDEATAVHYHSQWEAAIIDAAEKLIVSNPGRMRVRQTQEWA